MNIILKEAKLFLSNVLPNWRYPIRLIPKKNYSIISESNLNPNDFLGVHVDSSILLKDSDGKLNIDAIDVKRIPGFSSNKLPRTKVRDLFINLFDKVKFRQEWKSGTDGVYPNNDEYEFDTKRQYYFFKIKDVNGYKGKYNHASNKEKSFEFKLKIIHKPLISNYWHFEFSVESEHAQIQKTDAAWKRLVCSSIRDRIQEKSIFKI